MNRQQTMQRLRLRGDESPAAMAATVWAYLETTSDPPAQRRAVQSCANEMIGEREAGDQVLASATARAMSGRPVPRGPSTLAGALARSMSSPARRGAWSMSGTTPARGAALSALADQLARTRRIPYDAALLEAQRLNPGLY